MSYNDPKRSSYVDINECTSRGACSISPAISSLQELVLVFLQQTAYYILKLEQLGASNNNIKYEIINTLSSLVSVNEFNENQLYEIARNSYFLLEDTKKNYKIFYKSETKQAKELKPVSDFNAATTLPQAIALGDKINRNKYKKLSQDVKNYKEILLILLKSVSLNLTKLNDFKVFDNDIYHEILNILEMLNSNNITTGNIKEKIIALSEFDFKLQSQICSKLFETFGKISQVKVSHSTRSGKAILVSGNNFFDLLDILEKTKNENIDIYTHSNLLIVHSLNRFRKFPHLKGHYGDLTENCILDFATFPGAILLTKNFRSNKEYFYRGRLFSTDYIVPNGVIKVENNNYNELIETAKNSKGFSKGKIKEDTTLGYDETELLNSLKNISDKLKDGTYKRLYIIGNNSHLEAQKIYFKEFFKNLSDEEFVISFSETSKKDNILNINVGDYMPLISGILEKFFNLYPINSGNIIFMFTTCDVMNLSAIVLLKHLGAKNIYMTECAPTIINPAVAKTYKKEFKIKTTTHPKNDIIKIRQNNKSSQ